MLTEERYDSEFSPKIKRLGEEVKAAGGSFVAIATFEGGSEASSALTENAGPDARVTLYAARSAGNVDKLFGLVMRDAEKYGGVEESVYLSMLKSFS